MAKYESNLTGDFQVFLKIVHDGIIEGSASASLEDGSYYENNNVRCAVRVYERYSYAGGNRVSLNVTLLGNGNDLFISAITSGGSRAVFFKINTLGEETFLNRLVDIVERFKGNN